MVRKTVKWLEIMRPDHCAQIVKKAQLRGNWHLETQPPYSLSYPNLLLAVFSDASMQHLSICLFLNLTRVKRWVALSFFHALKDG